MFSNWVSVSNSVMPNQSNHQKAATKQLSSDKRNVSVVNSATSAGTQERYQLAGVRLFKKK